MKEPDPLGNFEKLLLRKRLEEIVAILATLYFPTGIVAQLNEICDESGYTPGQLIVKALKGQIYHWDKFYQYVSTPPEKSSFVMPDRCLIRHSGVSNKADSRSKLQHSLELLLTPEHPRSVKWLFTRQHRI